MEKLEKLQLNLLNKIHNRQVGNESSSSDSEEETESRNSFGTSLSGASDVETPRSLTSDESSVVTSPRANLLWDHGFDVANAERISPDERETEWRCFNKTDDDKIIADKRMKIQEIAHKLQEINVRESKQNSKTGQGLPDLIPSASLSSVHSSVRSSQETLYAIEDLDPPPPLPESDPPNLDFVDSPPPLPTSSPPTLTSLKENDPEKIRETTEIGSFEKDEYESMANIDSDDTSELCNENPDRLDIDSDDSSSAAGDFSDPDADQGETNFDGFYNVQTNTVLRMAGETLKPNLQQEVVDDVEAEFDYILQFLNSDTESQNTYVERFAGRRDKYGFILSPVIEAPSPTPSNMSGYSGYSGISCSSPDPLGAFRMSPGPNRGSKQELDLSSLCVKPNDWDLRNEQTVPIYQTVQAKKVIVVPEGFGWESGDDLLSPTGSVEWDCYDNGLSTPPVSTTAVNLTQFGTHIIGWKQPDVAIYEEPENYNSDTTIDNEEDSGTDTTIDDDTPRSYPGDVSNVTVKECESPEKALYADDTGMNVATHPNIESIEKDLTSESVNILDESVQSLELSALEDEINEVENELKLLKMHTGRNDDSFGNGEKELTENTSNVIDMCNTKDEDSFRGFSAEIDQINQSHGNSVKGEQSQINNDVVSINSSLDRRCRKPICVDSKQASASTDDESDTTEESIEDAEDEYSDSDNENNKEDNNESDFDLFKAKPVSHRENNILNEVEVQHDKDAVSVSEMLSPRTAIILSGGMFPEETDISSFTSDESEGLGNVTPDTNMSSYGSGIKISQYTSGDSDDNCIDMTRDKVDVLKPDNESVNNRRSVDESLKNTEVTRNALPDQEDEVDINENAVSANIITINSPLDFSILDSKAKTSNRGELRKSPRIFGRYYTEMDDNLLEEVRYKCDLTETSKSEPELLESLTTESERYTSRVKKTKALDVDEFENSFKQIDITDSSSTKLKEKFVSSHKGHFLNNNAEQVITDSQDRQDEFTNDKDRNIHKQADIESFDSSSVVSTELRCVTHDVIENSYIQKQDNLEVLEKQKTSAADVMQQLSINTKKNSPQNVDHNTHTKLSPKSHKSPMLKLKIGHLGGNDSAKFKIKRGYVHEISELFDKTEAKHEDFDLEKKVSKKRRAEVERAQTPTIMKPNENIVIYENNANDTFEDTVNIHQQESLGFEVTPLLKVNSFEDLSDDETRNKTDNENNDQDIFHYSSDENSFDMSDCNNDDEIKRYEDQLREMQTDWGEYNEDYTSEANAVEDISNYINSGTTEFVPKIHTFGDVNTRNQSLRNIKTVENVLHSPVETLENDHKISRNEYFADKREEIEESIDGDTDSNQSEDEDFHQRYFLPGHSYHINDPRNRTDITGEVNQETVETTDDKNTKHKFSEASSCEEDENVAIETSNGTQNSNWGADLQKSQQGLSRYEDYESGRCNIEQTEREDERAKCDRNKTTSSSISDSGGTEVKHSNYGDSNAEMSNILWKIPWKPLKERKQEKATEKSAESSNENRRKQSGYLYDIISRIETKLKPKAAESELQKKVTDKNEVIDDQCATKDSLVCLNVKDKLSPTALSEKGEFDFLEDSANNASFESNTTTGTDYLPRKRHVFEYDEDPKFKIRYPSSLSRRLYGPYCRLRSNESVLFEDENERETIPVGLSQTFGRNVNTVTDGGLPHFACQRPEGLNGKNKQILCLQGENDSENNEKCQQNEENLCSDDHLRMSVLRQSPVSYGEISDTFSSADNSSIHSDDQNSNPDHFNYTCYEVKTPFSSITQRDGINFNLKQIIGGERNQAQQKPLVCESNFVVVNLQHEGSEAKTDKQKCDFSETAYYGGNNCDVKFTKLPMHLECRSADNKNEHENSGEINNNNLGVDTITVAVKNDQHYTSLGVHIPPELSTNERRQQNVDMNNDSVSASHIVSSVKTNKPGINRISASVTTQNINSHPMSSGDAVTEDKPVSNGDIKTPEADEKHMTRTSVVLQTPGFQHVLEDERGKLSIWPYSDFDNSDKLPVTLHRVKKGINVPVKKGMSSNMTVIQSAEHSAEMPENRVVHKYHSSSILPADRTTGQIMKAHGDSVQSVLLQDSNGNNVSEEEIASVLPKIAESISKMDSSNAEELLPGITQSITQLKNGGNLVITTMTRKLDEEESSSSGRGSPEPDYPVLNVDDLENSKIYLVQDSKGEMFYVEDVTSDTQESAYFSSRHTSESVSDTGNSPTFDRISKINSVGQSGIKESTAQEILSAMYGDNDVKELTENEEEWSERTYEYDFPRRRDKDYSKDSFKTSYMVEEPGDTLPKLKTATAKDKHESSYQMSGGAPWVYDGGMAQSYSQVTQGVFLDEANSVSAVSTQNVDNSGVKTIERYTVEGEVIDYPAPAPVFMPPMVVQTDVPQYSLVKVDVTPKHKDEGVMAQIEAPKPEEPTERPIYKTVAHIQTPDKVPSPKPVEKKKYKIIASKATETEEEQETHMRFDEIDYKFTSENVEYTMKPATAETQYFVKNTTKVQPPSQFRSEKRIDLGKSSDQKYKSQIQVQEPKQEVYEQSSYSYDQMKSEFEQTDSNMRVVRGSYLIKNTLDDADTELDDNINMFDRNFTMCKDNPLYHSDEDLYRRLERERIENARRQERLQRDLNQDISFETVDRFSKSKAVKREPEKPRQSLYELLMSRLSTVEAKDIRQNIDVKHNHEDIYGDPRFMQADGEYLQNIAGTNNFETVGEKVDLMLKEGKAYITIKVTAERITPVDLEFNVWRKNQAIVTRTIEVDLLATEQRRRLYYKVMEQPAGGSRGGYRAGPNETVLDSKETLELFSKILGAADGEGDTEDIEVKTRSGKTTRPFSSGMDLLY